MNENTRFLSIGMALIVVTALMVGLAKVQAHPSMPGSEMMGPSQMTMNQAQMQRQMAQMNNTVKALGAQLSKINPDLLTGQERPMYEYLKLLQAHLETMQGRMMQMPGMMGR